MQSQELQPCGTGNFKNFRAVISKDVFDMGSIQVAKQFFLGKFFKNFTKKIHHSWKLLGLCIQNHNSYAQVNRKKIKPALHEQKKAKIFLYLIFYMLINRI